MICVEEAEGTSKEKSCTSKSRADLHLFVWVGERAFPQGVDMDVNFDFCSKDRDLTKKSGTGKFCADRHSLVWAGKRRVTDPHERLQ